MRSSRSCTRTIRRSKSSWSTPLAGITPPFPRPRSRPPPPFPAAWIERGVRLIEPGRPLPRPQAANAGLDSATGAMIGFLDDDDTFDPNHVSTLMAHYNPMKPLQVIYSGARVIDDQGR